LVLGRVKTTKVGWLILSFRQAQYVFQISWTVLSPFYPLKDFVYLANNTASIAIFYVVGQPVEELRRTDPYVKKNPKK